MRLNSNVEVGWLSCNLEEFYARPYESNQRFTKEMLEGCPPMSPEMVEQLKVLEAMSDEDIDFSDIPPLTDKQLKSMQRVNQISWDLRSLYKNG